MLYNTHRKLQDALTEIFRLDDRIEQFREACRAQCAEPRDMIKDILTELRDNGVNMVAFRQLLSEQRTERRMQMRAARLDRSDAEALEAMWAALGDFATTPLGQSALERA